MRIAVLFALIGLLGCSKRAPVPAPPAENTPQAPSALPVAPQPHEPSFVPQTESNLRQLDRTRKSADGLDKDLALGRFKYGGKLEEVIAAYPPDVLFDHDGFRTAAYGHSKGHFLESLGHTFVVEKNGKLIWAFGQSCVWRPVYFEGVTDAERQAWSMGYVKALREYAWCLFAFKRGCITAMLVSGKVSGEPSTSIPPPREVDSTSKR
jgi:hypothetical protein